MIGLDMIRLLEDIVVRGKESGEFRPDVEVDRAVVLIGQQIYGALSVRAGEPESVPAAQGQLPLSTTRLASVPIPSMVTATLSPATSGPIPAGVPVSSTSPGIMVMTDVT